MNNEVQYLTVTELNHYIKINFDEDENLRYVYLKGEISNFKNHTTGHLYFTLKDENSRMLAVMFKNSAYKLKFTPTDGMKVLVIGRISVYEANGNYQIYVEEMTEDGIGNLYIEFEKLKEKLNKLGYFDSSLKKSIPYFPKRIGIITASTGAAIHDIITTINRRYCLAEVFLFPSLVQGNEAKNDIVKNIILADNYDLDVIILARGGGSIEDLWPFNEEIVAKAVYEAKTPIITGVGHEVDTTIVDFISDLRAATPTAAAELVVPNKLDLLNTIRNYRNRAYLATKNLYKNSGDLLLKLINSYVLKTPMNIYEIKSQKLDNTLNKLEYLIKEYISKYNNKYVNLLDRLTTLNPLLTIKRGYAIIRKNDSIVSSSEDIRENDIVKIEIKDGKIEASVRKVEKNGKEK